MKFLLEQIKCSSFFTLVILFCSSCGGFKYKLISNTDSLKIYYIDSKKIGKRVNAELTVANKRIDYNIYLGYEGLPIHIIRYLNTNISEKNELDFLRSQEFLITDTTKDNEPNYLGNPINGYYYDTSIYNRLNELPKVISTISKYEYPMFKEIEKVLLKRGVKFKGVDSSKIIGWFKYDF